MCIKFKIMSLRMEIKSDLSIYLVDHTDFYRSFIIYILACYESFFIIIISSYVPTDSYSGDVFF